MKLLCSLAVWQQILYYTISSARRQQAEQTVAAVRVKLCSL